MADQRQPRGATERPGRTRKPALTAAEAGQHGLQQIAELTGKDPETVTGVEPTEEDGWVVTVEVIEDRRIPSATDVLASYEAEIGPDGELISYRRLRRYSRGRGDDGTA
jgi:hypothetical protein